MSFSDNLPPGTSMSDPRAPWNAPEEYEVDFDELVDLTYDLDGDLFFPAEDTGWQVEDLVGNYWRFETEHDCVAFLLAEREDQLTEALLEEKREEEIDRAYDVSSGEAY